MRNTARNILAVTICVGVFVAAALPPMAVAANPHSNAGGNGNGKGNGKGNGGGGENGNGNGSVVHQYAVANGIKQGTLSSELKSWNSLNANPKALLNNLNNPNSLLGKEARYICANAASQTDLTTFTAAGGNPSSPPTQEQSDGASAYLAAVALLNGADPATVAADPTSSAAQIAAANLLIANAAASVPLTPTSAQAIVSQYAAWTAYQGAEGTAQSDFLAASVSYKGATYDSTMSALRTSVDGVIAQKGLDTPALCTTTASAQ